MSVPEPGRVCVECGHDHFHTDREGGEGEVCDVGDFLCCTCDREGRTATMLHEPIYTEDN